MDIHIGHPAAITRRLSEEIVAAADRAIADRGRFSIAIPGGSVATECFPALVNLPLDWNLCHFFWADERAVPPSDPDSNYQLASRLWLEPARVPAASVHRMAADAPVLSSAADAYGDDLARLLGAAPVLDVVLLGMGPDGHVASLFPGHAVLREQERVVSVVTDAPKPPPGRLTLTLPMLARARRAIVVAFGAPKAEALAEAVKNADSPLPAAQLLQRSRSSLVLADNEAGRLIADS
jgi:6-phosphogluconolactonase